MARKLTISIDDRVYDGLHAIIGRGNIGKFLEELARPFVLADSLSATYAEMSADEIRDNEAMIWCESLADNASHAPWSSLTRVKGEKAHRGTMTPKLEGPSWPPI
jgi:hypothetical protein